jgi:hypothetical protein
MTEDRWKALSDAGVARARRYTCDDAVVLFEQALEAVVRKPAQNQSAPSAGTRVS